MNTLSASPAESPVERGLVWDAPVRVFHWLMTLSFAGAYLTAESKRWRLVQVTLGSMVAGLVAFRVVWRLVGTRHARFASFVRGPAGALAIVALLELAAAVTATGYAGYNELGGEGLKELHEAAANLMLAIVGVHIAGVLVTSWMHGGNLIGAMVTGRKASRPEDGVRRAWRSVAALMIAAVLGFWAVQWQSAPAAVMTARPSTSARHSDNDDG